MGKCYFYGVLASVRSFALASIIYVIELPSKAPEQALIHPSM
jgi:hypothetical protein